MAKALRPEEHDVTHAAYTYSLPSLVQAFRMTNLTQEHGVAGYDRHLTVQVIFLPGSC